MFCKKCGQQLNDGVKFCSKCGNQSEHKGSKFKGGGLPIFLFSLLGIPFLIALVLFPVGTIFAIIILNLVFPWVISIILKWIFKNSIIDGQRLRFKGTGVGLFGRYVLWGFLTIITFGIYHWWSIRNQIRWVIENIEIDSQTKDHSKIRIKSKFKGGVLPIFLFPFWAIPFMVITLNLAFPWVISIILKWIFKHSTIDGKQLSFKGTGLGLFGRYILWWFLAIITFGIYNYWAIRNQIRWVIENIEVKEGCEQQERLAAEQENTIVSSELINKVEQGFKNVKDFFLKSKRNTIIGGIIGGVICVIVILSIVVISVIPKSKNLNEIALTHDGTFAKGQVVYVEAARLNMRDTDSREGKQVKLLEFGAQLTILEKGRQDTINDIEDYWYKVSTGNEVGWLFGAYVKESALTLSDDQKYVGQVVDGKPHGQGTETYGDGMKYEGQWQNGLKHGQGTYIYYFGNYTGQFKDGEMHGQGTLTWPDGRKYVGQWQNNQMHGEGTMYDPNGNIIRKGIFHNEPFGAP